MQKLLIIAAALVAASCGAATAQNSGQNSGQNGNPPSAQSPGGGDRQGWLASADTNHDGKISRTEFLAARDARFAQMDANHDGSLSADERPRWGGPNASAATQQPAAAPGGRGNRGDANGDGVISKAEYDDQAGHMFDRMDANHDGFLDQTEIQAMRDRRRDGGGQNQN